MHPLLSFFTISVFITSAFTLSILQDDRRAIFVDLSRCQNPKAVQPNIQTIESNPSFSTAETSLCGLRDTSDFCRQAAQSQIEFTSASDGSTYTFRIPTVYESITVFVWLQEQDFPQFWSDPVKAVGGTIVTHRKEGQSEATVRGQGTCPNGKPCHEAEGFEISRVYFQTENGGVIGKDRVGVTTSTDPYERLIIEYCG